MFLFGILCLCLQSSGALEFVNDAYSPGWWMGMSNDSFGIGIPSEADDQHTVGLQVGYKTDYITATLLYCIYTNRGTDASNHSRTDRLQLLLGRQDTFTIGLCEIYWQLAGCLGVDGNLGGYWMQHLFHYSFLNYRLIPDLSTYDSLHFYSGLEPYTELSMRWGGLRFGVEFDCLLTYPLLVTLEPGLFLMYRGGDTATRFSATLMMTPVVSGFRTFDLVQEYIAGLWLNGLLTTGGLFYHFSYNPVQQITDGRIGFQWSQRTPAAAAALWDMLEVGIELLNLGPEVVYEENTFFQLHFNAGLPGGMYYGVVKNGGQYVDKSYSYNAKNIVLGVGYEQHLPSSLKDSALLDPYIGFDLFIEQVREHTIPAYRSATVANLGIFGSSLHVGMGFWLPSLVGAAAQTGLRLSIFTTLPHLTFGSGVDSPGLALVQHLRWGLRLGILARI